MALSVNANVASLYAQQNLGRTQEALQSSVTRLSSGVRVNADRPQGADTVTPVSSTNVPSTSTVLKISPEAMALSRQDAVSSARSSAREANELITNVQTADAALGQVISVLQRAFEQASHRENGMLSASDQQAVQTELASLSNEVNRLAQTTTGINGQKLLDGSYQGQSAAVNGTRMSVSALPNVTELTGTRNGTLESSASIKKALEAVNGLRTGLSTGEKTTTVALSNLPSTTGSQAASLTLATAPATTPPVPSGADDQGTPNLTRAQLLQQAGNAMMAQANSRPQLVLSLLS